EAARLLLSLYKLIVDRAAELGNGLRARFSDRSYGRFRLAVAAPLYLEFLLLVDELLKRFEILQLRAEFPVVKRTADVDSLLDDRNDRFQLGDGGGCRRALGFLLCALTVEGAELGSVLADLVQQKLSMPCDLCVGRAFRRLKVRQRIAALAQRGVQPRDIELN